MAGFMQISSPLTAYRVRTCYPMQEACARGKALFSALSPLDNALLLVQDGRIQWMGAYSPKALPAGMDARHVQDLGEQIMVPAIINAHTHTQLAHLAQKTLWGEGFVPWLKSLIPLLSLPYDSAAIATALQHMQAVGTGYFADFGHGGLGMVAEQAQSMDMEGLLLGEWFGFEDIFTALEYDKAVNLASHLPARMRDIYTAMPQETKDFCTPCVHALYSTAATVVQGVHAWCTKQKQAHKRPFVLHLAEFPEEEELLTQGTGALADLFRGVVVPESWQAPGLHPIDYAAKLGVLTENTLAIHAVHCEQHHVQSLSEARLSVCLCPRSNTHLAVGRAPVASFMQSHVALCLGTDGLTSNTCVDVWQDALYLQEHFSVPGRALLRMLTVNGAQALGVHYAQNSCFFGTLHVGARADWSFVPKAVQI